MRRTGMPAPLLACFDEVFVVNLASRADRRREMAAQLGRIEVNAGPPAVVFFAAIRPSAAGGFPSIGARGCFLSHLHILRDAARRGVRSVLIFEDDLDFAPDFLQRAAAVGEGLRRSAWSLFYGVHEAGGPLAAPDPGGLSVVAAENAVRTTAFLGIQQPAIAALAACMEAMLGRPAGDPRGGPMHVDGAYNWYRKCNPQSLTLAAVPQLGQQRSSRSDVHELRWYDRLPLARQAVAGLRRTRNALRQ